MIFQAGIPLKITNKNVQAIIDFDTGLIGFTEELANNSTREYNFQNCPISYKTALFDALKPKIAQKTAHNLEICRKSEVAEVLRQFWSENKSL